MDGEISRENPRTYAEFNKLMPVGGSPSEQLTQRDKFFVVLILTNSNQSLSKSVTEYSGDGTIPNTNEMFKRLQVSFVYKENTSSSTMVEHFALTSQCLKVI